MRSRKPASSRSTCRRRPCASGKRSRLRNRRRLRKHMPLLNRAAEMQPEIAAWRRDLHMRPELLFEVHETARFVEEKLRAFGCDEIVTGLGRTGVVGVIRGRHGEGPVIGLRADMDA